MPRGYLVLARDFLISSPPEITTLVTTFIQQGEERHTKIEASTHKINLVHPDFYPDKPEAEYYLVYDTHYDGVNYIPYLRRLEFWNGTQRTTVKEYS